MSRRFLDGKVELHGGDSREVLKTLPEASVDSVVCDPPYGLDFMGRAWDSLDGAPFAVEFWREVLRVLKPGGHLVAFSGTRTYHRLACAIEDAGFEIRDCLYWHYGSGFPKSHNVSKSLDATGARCVCGKDLHHLRDDMDSDDTLSGVAEPALQPCVQEGTHWETSHGETVAAQPSRNGRVRGLRKGQDDAAGVAAQGGDADMLAPVQRGVARPGLGEARAQGAGCLDLGEPRFVCAEDVGRGQPGMEGRRDLSTGARELQGRKVCEVPARVRINGDGERLCDGTQARDGAMGGASADKAGVCAPSGPRSTQQRAGELGTVAVQPDAQARGAWPSCGRCGKPIIPDGLGTALKPSTEPIVLARRPLIGTVAQNVTTHGTGALNIGGCRIGVDAADPNHRAPSVAFDGSSGIGYSGGLGGRPNENLSVLGRWPANLLHDGSEEVVSLFPASGDNWRANKGGGMGYHGGEGDDRLNAGHADTGSAARFFYTSKAAADDRLGSKHPTVKPVDLMQWLVRLVTPKNGLCLDPFAGTGTTGEAAWREGMRAILIEREEEYQADIARRMELAQQPTKRAAVAATKNQLDDPNSLPLFGGWPVAAE
jgi:DNA modification methylase